MTWIDTIALVITPQCQQHIGDDHHQRGALGQLLIQTKQYAQSRNGNQTATNTEQTAKGAE